MFLKRKTKNYRYYKNCNKSEYKLVNNVYPNYILMKKTFPFLSPLGSVTKFFYCFSDFFSVCDTFLINQLYF